MRSSGNTAIIGGRRLFGDVEGGALLESKGEVVSQRCYSGKFDIGGSLKFEALWLLLHLNFHLPINNGFNGRLRSIEFATYFTL